MSKIKLTGSNSGYVEISSAADAGNLTLSLPTAGTALLSNAGNVFSGITTFTGVNITDDITFNGASYNVVWDKSDNQLEFGDNAKLSFGASSDLQMYHLGGANSYIVNKSNNLYIQSNNAVEIGSVDTNGSNVETSARFVRNGASELFWNDVKKFETTNTGAVVSGICTATSFSGDGSALTGVSSPLSNRNMIINGAAMVSQRLGSDTYNLTGATDYFVADRFRCWAVGGGTLTIQRSDDAPAGFQNSLMFTVGTVDTDALSVGNTYYVMQQRIEGFNTRRLNMGQSNAQSSTLSFWVKSDVTGTYCVMLNNHAQNRSYLREFTVSSADTWEYKTLTYPGDTTGTWVHDSSGSGVQINWCLASGSNYLGTANQWNTAWRDHTSNQVNFMATSGNKIRFTGIQLEKGTTATEFEHRDYGEELARCQRYFYRVSTTASGTGQYKHIGTMQYYGSRYPYGKILDLPVPMRTIPTGSHTGTIRTWTAQGSTNGSVTTINYDRNDNKFLGSNGCTTDTGNGGSGDATPITLWTSSSMSANAEL